MQTGMLRARQQQAPTMRFRSATFGAIALSTLLACHANTHDDASRAVIAGKFVAALQHQRFQEAGALFAPEATRDPAATALVLKRIDDRVGGFSTMQPVAKRPDGQTIRLQVPAPENVPSAILKSIQFQYASTARDGKPVYYEVDVTADDKPPRVLWLGLHFPAEDAPSTARARQLVSAIAD